MPEAVPTRPAHALPLGLRNATVVCMVLSGLVGLFSASEAASLTNLSAIRESPARGASLFGDPKVMEKASEAQAKAYVQAIEPMQVPRGLTLGALAIVSGLAFVAAGRLLRPLGMPREGMRWLLGGALIAAAMLRAIDGAQMTVVAKRIGAAAGKVMLESEPYSSDPAAFASMPGLVATAIAGFAAVQTAVVAGGLLGLALYYRSEKVRQIIAFRDKQPGPT
jgi:hypothetical protein